MITKTDKYRFVGASLVFALLGNQKGFCPCDGCLNNKWRMVNEGKSRENLAIVRSDCQANSLLNLRQFLLV